MMVPESLWIANQISKLVETADEFALLNVGSSTGRFRRVDQPHIYKNIFEPIAARCSVDHLDMKAADGVDLVGDLTEPDFLEKLKRRSYDAVLCSNLLEHVTNPEEICRCMEACVKTGGFIIVTVPQLYPYHNDPIDTKFRPSINELGECFKSSSLVEGEIIVGDHSHLKVLLQNRKLMARTVARWFTPFYQYDVWKKVVSDIPNTLKSYRETCVVVRKR